MDIPTLVIVGAKDNVVSVEKCAEAMESMKSFKKLEILENEGHTFHNRADKLLKSIIKFLEL